MITVRIPTAITNGITILCKILNTRSYTHCAHTVDTEASSLHCRTLVLCCMLWSNLCAWVTVNPHHMKMHHPYRPMNSKDSHFLIVLQYRQKIKIWPHPSHKKLYCFRLFFIIYDDIGSFDSWMTGDGSVWFFLSSFLLTYPHTHMIIMIHSWIKGTGEILWKVSLRIT